MPDMTPLTAEEIAQLPNGTTLHITWSGGNGPHEYTLLHAPTGGGTTTPYAATPTDLRQGRITNPDRILTATHGIGPHPLTQVYAVTTP